MSHLILQSLQSLLLICSGLWNSPVQQRLWKKIQQFVNVIFVRVMVEQIEFRLLFTH